MGHKNDTTSKVKQDIKLLCNENTMLKNVKKSWKENNQEINWKHCQDRGKIALRM